MAVAFVVYTFIMFIPAIAYSGRLSWHWRNRRNLGRLAPAGGLLIGSGNWITLRFTLLADLSAKLRIIVLSLAYMIAYVTIVVGFLGERIPMQVLLALIRDALPARLSVPEHLRFREGRD